MAEGRMLKKAISTSRKLAQLNSNGACLLYTWLIPHLDIEGRFFGDPEVIKGYIFPRISRITPGVVQEYLNDLVENELIILYSANGDTFLQLTKFKDFQLLRSDREASSHIPAPPTPGVLQDNSGSTPAEVKLNKDNKDPSASIDAVDAVAVDAVEKENNYITRKNRMLSGQKLVWFLEFWKVFKYAKGKAEAADAWLDIQGLNDALFQFILKGAEREASRRPDLIAQSKTPKMAQGWLSGKRWEDEHSVSKPKYAT